MRLPDKTQTASFALLTSPQLNHTTILRVFYSIPLNSLGLFLFYSKQNIILNYFKSSLSLFPLSNTLI